MSYKLKTFWDDVEKVSKTIIVDTFNNKKYEGVAKCAPDDYPYAKEYVGETISQTRAKIEMLKDIRDNEIKPQIKILNHLYTNMSTSTNFNPKSYEAKMLHRQLQIKRADLNAVNDLIESMKQYIKDYLDNYMYARKTLEKKAKNRQEDKVD